MKDLLALLVIVIGVGVVVLGNQPPCMSLGCFLFGIGCPKFTWHGTIEPGWEEILRPIELNFKHGYEIGSQLTIFHEGRKVVDIAVGYDSNKFENPYALDTVQLLFSSTKFVTSVVIMMLIDQGKLELDAPIARYWPNFAMNGKEKVTVGDLMSHGGGLHHIGQRIDYQDMHDDEKLRRKLEQTKLDLETFRGNGRQGYHGITRGLFANELCKIVDGRTISQFAHEEIFQKIQTGKDGERISFRIGTTSADKDEEKKEGAWYGLPHTKVFFRLLPQFFLPKAWTEQLFQDVFIDDVETDIYVAMGQEGTIAYNAFVSIFGKGPDDGMDNPAQIDHFLADTKWKTIHSSSSHGISNGYTLARLANVFANEGTDPISGVTLVSKETLSKMTEYHPALIDQVFRKSFRYSKIGMSADVGLKARPPPTWQSYNQSLVDQAYNDDMIGWCGAGGSHIVFSRASKLAIGFTVNFYQPHILDWRAVGYVAKAHEIARTRKGKI